jgi:hypothetical protein
MGKSAVRSADRRNSTGWPGRRNPPAADLRRPRGWPRLLRRFQGLAARVGKAFAFRERGLFLLGCVCVGGAFGHRRGGTLRQRVPNSSASAAAVRFFDRDCPTYRYRMIAVIRGGLPARTAPRDERMLGHPHRHRGQVEHLPPLHPGLRRISQIGTAPRRTSRARGAPSRRDGPPTPASIPDARAIHRAGGHSCGATTAARAWCLGRWRVRTRHPTTNAPYPAWAAARARAGSFAPRCPRGSRGLA